MKKIFFVLPTIGFGGAEKVYIEMAEYLNRRSDIIVKLIYFTSISNERILPEKLNAHCLNVKNVKSGLFKLNTLLKKEKPDVVFSSLQHLNILVAFIKRFFFHDFKLFIRHTNILSMQKKSFLQSRIELILIKYFYNKTDRIIFQSEYMKDDFQKVIDTKKYTVINNPINLKHVNIESNKNIDSFDIDSSKINMIFIGRLTNVKNVNYIINFIGKIKEKNALHLYIIGDGDEKYKLVELTENKGLSSYVTFLGHKKNPYKYLKRMDFLINASKSEGFPNSILESFALDIPVLVRAHPGGTLEIMKQMSLEKYFYNEFDFEDLKKIKESYPSFLSNKIETNYGIEKIALKYIDLINEDLRGQK